MIYLLFHVEVPPFSSVFLVSETLLASLRPLSPRLHIASAESSHPGVEPLAMSSVHDAHSSLPQEAAQQQGLMSVTAGPPPTDSERKAAVRRRAEKATGETLVDP